LPLSLAPNLALPNALPMGVQARPSSSLSFSDFIAAIYTAPGGNVVDAGFLVAQLGWGQLTGSLGSSQLDQMLSLVNFCKQDDFPWAVQAVTDLLMRTARPTYTTPAGPDPFGGSRLYGDGVYPCRYKLFAARPDFHRGVLSLPGRHQLRH